MKQCQSLKNEDTAKYVIQHYINFCQVSTGQRIPHILLVLCNLF